MRSRYWIALLVLIIFAPTSLADPGNDMTMLMGEDLREAFADRTHFGTYKEFRELTGTNKFTEKMKGDGTTYYKEGDMHLTGRWNIVNEDNMCFLYNDFPGLHCFVMFQSGTCIYGYNPSWVKEGKPVRLNAWTVKSVRNGDVSTCDDLIG